MPSRRQLHRLVLLQVQECETKLQMEREMRMALSNDTSGARSKVPHIAQSAGRHTLLAQMPGTCVTPGFEW